MSEGWGHVPACRALKDLEVPFRTGQAEATFAREFCERCPVRDACLELAMDAERLRPTARFGVFGGLTPVQRRVLAILGGQVTCRCGVRFYAIRTNQLWCPRCLLKVEACEQLDDMAKEERCRIVGEVAWSIEDGRLYARAAAVPLAERKREPARRAPYRSLEGAHETIAALAAEGLSDQQIADRLGAGSSSGVRRARERHGIAAGQRKGRAA